MNNDKMPVVDMRWLANGEPDQFADYLKRNREDMPMADFSDDELANAAFMEYNRAPEVEMAMMVKHHEEKTLHLFHSRIGIMTAVKERLRWLSRRVAVLEGRYPGVPSPMVSVARFTSVEEAKAHLEKAEGYALPPHDQHSVYYDKPEYESCFSVSGELTIDDMKAIIFIHEHQDNDYAEGIAELKALGGTQDPKSFLEKASEQYLEDFANRQIEVLAKELYDTWSCKDDWVPWTERGNSDMQVLAREMVIKRLEEEGKQLLVGSSANFALRQKNYHSPKTAEESQWYKEMEEFLMELEPEYKLSGQINLNKVIDTLITKSTVDWETFCKGFSFNPVDATPLSISYELKLKNLAEFREQWDAGKFKPAGEVNPPLQPAIKPYEFLGAWGMTQPLPDVKYLLPGDALSKGSDVWQVSKDGSEWVRVGDIFPTGGAIPIMGEDILQRYKMFSNKRGD